MLNNKVFIFLKRIVLFSMLFLLFVLSLELMKHSLAVFGDDFTNLLSSVKNPFIGLFAGMLVTAIIQSSSTTSTTVVILVAQGTISMEAAIPIIIGANIGTSVTSSIVSIGYITDKKEFRKAITIATLHDFFNIIITLILLPAELFFGVLSKLSTYVVSLTEVSVSEPVLKFNFLKTVVDPVIDFLVMITQDNALVMGVVAVMILLSSIYLIARFFKTILIGDIKDWIREHVFNNNFKSLLWGASLTSALQSSSVTTSLIVPVAASSNLEIRKVFYFLMGANIGTTITALVAGLMSNQVALVIAVVHFSFNILGVLIMVFIKPLRRIPIFLAEWLGKASTKNKFIGVAYVFCVFFVIPFLLILITK